MQRKQNGTGVVQKIKEKNSLNITKIPKDIKKTFTKEYGVKWKGR